MNLKKKSGERAEVPSKITFKDILPQLRIITANNFRAEVSQSTVVGRFVQIGKVKRMDKWISCRFQRTNKIHFQDLLSSVIISGCYQFSCHFLTLVAA